MIKKICLHCGKEFQTYPSKIKIGKGKYCNKECAMINTNKILEKNGEKTRFFKGRKIKGAKGWRFHFSRKGGMPYKEIYLPLHPFCTKAGYIREHRLMMEKHLGRYLKPDEIVHHKDVDTLNNQLSNLQLMQKRDHDKMNVGLNIHRRWIIRNPVGVSFQK